MKHVRATAIHGWGTLSGIVVGEWLEDISRNQVMVFRFVHLASDPAKLFSVIYEISSSGRFINCLKGWALFDLYLLLDLEQLN